MGRLQIKKTEYLVTLIKRVGRQIDLWGREPLESKKWSKKCKNLMSIFPMYFQANFFVILKVVATPQKSLKTLEFF